MEDHYSSEEEEVYFGSVAESEVLRRRRFLGPDYNSPVTPRPPRFNRASSGIQGGLPDVLGTANTSTPVQRQLSAGSKSDPSIQNHVPLDDSLDDVIILDASGNSNSVITLSDDESFIRNEETCSNKSACAENVNGSMEKGSASICEVSNNSDTAEISKPYHESSSSGKDFVSNSGVAEDKSLHESAIHNSENGNNLNDNSVFNSEISIKTGTATVIEPHHENFSSAKDFVSNSVIAEEKSLHEPAMYNSENEHSLNDDSSSNYFESYILHTTPDKYCDSKVENISCSLVQDIDEFVNDSKVFEKSSATVDQISVIHSPIIPNNPERLNLSSGEKDVICHHSSSGEKGPETSSFIASKFLLSKEPSELQNSINIVEEEETDTSAGKHGKHSLGMSGMSNLEFSLDKVTDSVLNISHGSSLPSPPDTNQSVSQKPNWYEDISCNDDQLVNITDISNFDEKIHQEDLHMSVDEVDFQRQGFSDNFVASSSLGNSNNCSQPSEYKSCPSAYSSYITAYDRTCNEKDSTSEQSNNFQNYRDVSTDLDFCTEMDAISIKSNEENPNESNFEMVMQNRQNSFNGTPASNVSENNKEKVMSKLPVYQNPKSLLRPPKFYVKPDTLKTSSYKFAKQISKVGSEKKSSNLPKPEICKIPGPSNINKHVNTPSTKEKKIPSGKEKTFTKTPNKISTPKQNMAPPKQVSSLTKSNIPSHNYLSVNKTPAQNVVSKTPAKIAVNRTPAQHVSAIPKAVKSDSKVNRLLTPLRDYNTNGLNAGKSIPTKSKYKNIISPIQSYIRGSPPVSQRKAKFISEEQESPKGQSKTQNVPPAKSAPRAVQKLKYENVEGQENVNPNVIDPSRDTLPCKILEPSLEVFWKEREQPQPRLPKMGEKLTKILAGPPKVKVTIHEGRVNQSPMSKGILVPNNENSTSTSSDIINVDSLPTEQSDGRISVRMQKTVELP